MDFSSIESVDSNQTEKGSGTLKDPTFVPAHDPSASGSGIPDMKPETMSPALKEENQQQGQVEDAAHHNNKSVRYLTCYFWKFAGGCKKSAAQCAYAHHNTGVFADKPIPSCHGGRAVAGKNAQYARSMQNGFDKMPEFPISPGSSNVKLAGVSFGPSGYQSQYADLSMNPQAMNLQHSIGNTTCQPPSPFMRSMSFGNQSTPERRLTVGAGRPTSSPQGIPTFQNFQPSYHATPTYTSAPRISTQDHMELVYSNMNMMMAARRLDEGLCNIQAGLVEISRNIHEIHKKNGIATAEELTGVQKLIQQQHAQAGLARSTSMRFVKDESNCSSIFDHQV